MTPIESTLRSVRVLHLIFLLTVALFIINLRMLQPAERGISFLTVSVFVLLCLSDIAIAISFRARMITPSIERLRVNPQDAAALGRWRSGVITSFTFAETVVLLGFMLKILGAGWNVAGVFFVVGILLLLAWAPKLDMSRGN
ncbi:MAG TPA: hypothetical protein VGR03_08205 [Candidatus Acidoferrum sp.]|nr:hypothetical protein [Candidatus Acidoferrum sp.]